jgi:hypothetical protein
LITRSSFVKAYLDPILFVLATMSVMWAFKIVTLPFDDQHADFVTFWDNVRWYAAGHDLYTAPLRADWQGPNLNPPALLLLIVPLGFLPLTVAHVTWMVISVIMYAIIARWVGRELQLPVGRILSLLLISQATFFAIAYGTLAAPIAACVTRAWLAQRRQRDQSAGIWIGIAVACKLFLLPFVGYAVVRRRWRMCGGIAIGIASVITLGVVIFGLKNTELWIRTVGGVPPFSYGLNGSWMAWLARGGLVPDLKSLRALGLTGGAIIASLMLWRWFRSDDDHDAQWIGIISGSLLASPLGWSYYAPLLIGPFAGHNLSALLWVAYGLFCIPFDVLIWSPSRAWALTVGSAYFWGFLVLFVASLLPQIRISRSLKQTTAAS